MTSSEAPLLMVFAEDRLSFRLAVELADRLFESADAWWREQEDWNSIRDNVREWGPIQPDHREGKWTSRSDLKHAEVSVFDLDASVSGAALLALKAYKLAALRQSRERPRGVALVIALDADKSPKLAQQIREAVASSARGKQSIMPLALSVPCPEAEAWVVAGFIPVNQAERERLDKLKSELAFDPTLDSHRLTSNTADDPRDAKRCFYFLAEGVSSEKQARDGATADGGRGEQCWQQTSVAELKARGQHNNLASYLEDVEAELLPLLTRLAAFPAARRVAGRARRQRLQGSPACSVIAPSPSWSRPSVRPR